MAKSSYYRPSEISRMSESEIRKEYSRLRSIANKRLMRQESAGVGIRARTGFRFATIEQIESSSKWTVSSQLADVSAFLRSPRTTVKGEKRFLSQFRDRMVADGRGELVDTVDKIYNLLELLDEKREELGAALFSSGDVFDVYEEADRLNMPFDMVQDNYSILLENIDKLENIEPTKGGRSFDKRRMDALIRKWK